LQRPHRLFFQRNGAGHGFREDGCPGSRHLACGRRGANDIRLDHDVGRAADHHQMLDIVAAYQDELAAGVHRGGVDHGEAWLAPAPAGGCQGAAAEPAHQPGGEGDQHQDHDKGNNELGGPGDLHSKPAIH
jgi:hypothetical protein